MEMRELTIRKREGIGKGPARRLRRAGQVPAPSCSV
jgi:ribosomal protein L25 (general stress protein Ctc)